MAATWTHMKPHTPATDREPHGTNCNAHYKKKHKSQWLTSNHWLYNISLPFLFLPEQFRMTAKPDQLHHFIINPYQKKIILHMTFHVPCIIPWKHVRFKLLWYILAAFQKSYKIVKFLQFRCIVSVPLQVFSELTAAFNLPHSLQDFKKFSKLLVSIVFRFFPARASSMAALVSSLGSEYIASIKRHSTKLFRLLCSRLAALFSISNKSLLSLNAVSFFIATSISLYFL